MMWYKTNGVGYYPEIINDALYLLYVFMLQILTYQMNQRKNLSNLLDRLITGVDSSESLFEVFPYMTYVE